MKNTILIICLLTLGCSPSKKSISNNLNNKHWETDFKDRVLCNCMLSGIENKNITQQIKILDKSFYNDIDILLRDDMKIILKPILKQMKKDSIASLTSVGEGAAGKRIFDTCIKFYKSKALDSIAKVELKKWKRLDVDSLRSVLNPAY